MRIKATVEVPEGNFCDDGRYDCDNYEHCSFCNDELEYCDLFNVVLHIGVDEGLQKFLKYPACLNAEKAEE